MNDRLELIRCGCGGEAEVFHIAPEGYAGSYCVRCVECLTQTPFFTGNKEKAIEVWNRAMGADTKEKNMVFLMLMGQAMSNGILTVPPKETIRKDCSFYLEVQDMGAHVPSCTLYEGICNCRCENCTRYASKTDEI